ncbi:hypothetical protein HHX47_DHR9000286 [Lentinula edodes]|nr:hypothetical protein HHX47_DHR9000286 [Lentinula edodes]
MAQDTQGTISAQGRVVTIDDLTERAMTLRSSIASLKLEITQMQTQGNDLSDTTFVSRMQSLQSDLANQKEILIKIVTVINIACVHYFLVIFSEFNLPPVIMPLHETLQVTTVLRFSHLHDGGIKRPLLPVTIDRPFHQFPQSELFIKGAFHDSSSYEGSDAKAIEFKEMGGSQSESACGQLYTSTWQL